MGKRLCCLADVKKYGTIRAKFWQDDIEEGDVFSVEFNNGRVYYCVPAYNDLPYARAATRLIYWNPNDALLGTHSEHSFVETLFWKSQ